MGRWAATFISVQEIIQIGNVSIGVISKFVLYSLNEVLKLKYGDETLNKNGGAKRHISILEEEDAL